ncbi:hypothetical protein BBP00_00009584 [Phytophthora kernoviae]|uniref:COR domain-containing protein n=1 Tax=Phytophthora kernoviae TaxID=325452 RepID=A0A3F2RCG1_9STRA|nr:hypothetical protein BBP00_00009584 [Phytophthora kernoviae]
MASNILGSTALNWAASNGKAEVVALLLNQGADITAGDELGRTALHWAASYGNMDVVKLLLDRGGDMTAVSNDGKTVLHDAASSGKLEAVTLLLDHGADITAVDEVRVEFKTWAVTSWASAAASPGVSFKMELDHWIHCHGQEEPLTEVPTEVIIGGEADRTIGIDLVPFTFVESDDDGNSSEEKQRDVTFWDFAGQDIYQVSHALFFSKHSLYVLCVDVKAYNEKLTGATKIKGRSEQEEIMRRYFEENVLRWVRLILLRQPEAQLQVIGTKSDLVPTDHLKKVVSNVKVRLTSFLETLHGSSEISANAISGLIEGFNQNLETASVASIDSVKLAQDCVKRAVVAKDELSFPMTTTYTQVLKHVRAIQKQAGTSATVQDRVERMIVSIDVMCEDLMEHISDLESALDCRQILQVLHELGDISWYQNTHSEFQDMIILDPTIILDLVREVINHNYQGKLGEAYDALRRDGTLQHSLLMSFPFWKALSKADGEMVPRFKRLLQHFKLVYPADNTKTLDEADMIVPTYWKTRAAACASRRVSKRPSVWKQNNINGSAIAKWQYSLPVDISEAVYVNFIVRCYRPDVVRKVTAACCESSVRGEFIAATYFASYKAKPYDEITIEVAADTYDVAWVEMRYLIIAMEQVLLTFPGLESTKHLKRFVVTKDPREKNGEVSHEVTKLINDGRDEERLRRENPWLPPNFGWFIQHAWMKSGVLDKMLAEIHKHYQLEVLKKLIVTGEKRQFPALWTLSCPVGSSTIELRIHSDISGKCYHDPLQFTVSKFSSDFVGRHANFLQVGITVLSIASAVIPLAVASTAVEMVLSGNDLYGISRSSKVIGEGEINLAHYSSRSRPIMIEVSLTGHSMPHSLVCIITIDPTVDQHGTPMMGDNCEYDCGSNSNAMLTRGT